MAQKDKIDLPAAAKADLFLDWWNEWRIFCGVEANARLFGTAERTVRRWLAAGLAEHAMADGLETCAKHEQNGVMVWGLHPLGVTHWLVMRLAQGGNDAPLVVRGLADPAWWKFVWSVARDESPNVYDIKPAKFSWKKLGSDFRLFGLATFFSWIDADPDGGGPFNACDEWPEEMVARWRKSPAGMNERRRGCRRRF